MEPLTHVCSLTFQCTAAPSRNKRSKRRNHFSPCLCRVLSRLGQGEKGENKKKRKGPSETFSTAFASLFRVTAALGRKLIASR